MNQAKQDRHRAFFGASAFAAAALLMAGATGCGSGGGGKTTTPGVAASGGPITRANESTVSPDAALLATRQATGA